MLRTSLFASALMTLATPTVSAAAPQAPADSWPGLVTRSIETPAGRLTVNLPDDMRAGDTISGTVVAEPAGKSEAARERNRDTLGGYVVDVGGRRARRDGGILTFVVPAAGVLPLLVSSSGGRKRMGRSLFFAEAASDAPVPLDPPLIGQAGRPVSIPGRFDGSVGTTQVRVGGGLAGIIAESPRKVVFESPRAVVGPSIVQVSEGGVERQFPMRMLAVSLAAPKSVLKRGETITLSVRVEGLPPPTGTEPVQLTLVGSQTIQLENGNAQTVPLRADASGRATLERQITAVAPGAYQISAQVVGQQAAPKRDPLFPDALDMDGVNTVDQLTRMTIGLTAAELAALRQATLEALRQRLADAKDEATREYLRGKIAIVEAL